MDDLTLERTQWDTFWLPEGAHAVDRAELGYTTSASNQTYLNNVYRTRLSDGRLPAAIEEVMASHRGRTSRWTVVDASAPADLTTHLEAAGYVHMHAHRATWLPVGRFETPGTPHTVRVVRDRATLEDLLDVGEAAFGPRGRPEGAELDEEVVACGPGKRVQRFVVYEDERPVCGGGLNLYPELEFGFLWAGGTVPEARGRGAYRRLVAARLEAARRAGLKAIGLYARVGTSLPIVQGLGFETGGSMDTWDLAAGATTTLVSR